MDLSSSEEESTSDSSLDTQIPEVVLFTSPEGTEATATATATEMLQTSKDSGRGRRSGRKRPSGHRSKRKKRRWEWTIENLNKVEGATLMQAQKDDGEVSALNAVPDLTSSQVILTPEMDVSLPSETPAVGKSDSESQDVVVDSSSPADEPPISPWLIA